MKTSRCAAAIALALAASTVAAQGIQPGDLVAGFGDGDGYKRIDFNDISGGVFDSARALVLINSPLSVLQKILVAGPAGGRRVGIVQLNANGSVDTTFGNAGRALSTRTNVARFAGMVRMPNGDIVIGYSDDYTGQNDSKDFFIEVFTAQGQPKNIGGPEVQNQNYVDLSTDQSVGSTVCNEFYANATAHGLLLTGEGNLLLVGEQTIVFDGNPFNVLPAFAEFNGGNYGPARPAWGVNSPCRSFGGGIVQPNETNIVYDAVGVGGNAVHAAGVAQFRSSGSYGTQENILLGVGPGSFSAQVPDGFWRNGDSVFRRIRRDPNDPTQLLLFGERENGTFGSGIRLSPLVGRSQGTTLTPFFFLPEGQAAGTTMTLGDGARLAGSEQFWVLGSATACSAGNNCPRSWDSWSVGVSTGATLFNTYLPDTRFGTNGWVRNNVPNYDATPTGGSFGWRAELVRPTSSLLPSDLYVVGEFAYNGAINDYDWFVAKLRLFNSEAAQPVDAIFRDGYE